MYLLHSGKLKSYAGQNNHCKISVRSVSMEAGFKAWDSKQTFNTNTEGNIIVVECSFIKKRVFFLHRWLSFKFSEISKGLLPLTVIYSGNHTHERN